MRRRTKAWRIITSPKASSAARASWKRGSWLIEGFAMRIAVEVLPPRLERRLPAWWSCSPRAFSRTRRSGASCPMPWREGRVRWSSMRDYEGRFTGRAGQLARAVRGSGSSYPRSDPASEAGGADRHGADHHAVPHRRREPAAGASSHQRAQGHRRSSKNGFIARDRRFLPD